METIGSIIGMVSGLIAIYSFVTGTASLPKLRRTPSLADGQQVLPARPGIVRIVLLGLVFVVSLIATFAFGWTGSDTSGIMFVLLVLAGLSVAAYLLFLRRILSPTAFSITSIVGFTALGFFFGALTSGEEAAGLFMGVITGIGVPIIARSSQPSSAAVTPPSTAASQAPRGAAAPQSPAAPQSAATSQTGAGQSPPRTPPSTDAVHNEEMVLKAAQQQKGEVKVSDIALQTTLSLDEARGVLESLADRGYCQKSTVESGATIYRFPDFA